MKNSKAFDNLSGSEIAIIGMAGRFPGAQSIDAFWNNLRDGVESITFFTDEQLQASGVGSEALDNPNYVKARPVLADVELFDAAFFGFSPRDSEGMDPQHRLFMECVWEAIETAGYDAESYNGAISVYAGVSTSSYLMNNLYANPKAMALAGEYQSFLSNVPDSLATRIAYKLNLKGACYTVQTFCSTSLVAVHMACQSLLNYECDMAVAGGVTIFVPQNTGYWYQEGLIVSPDGHCRPFDVKAQGTVFGNGLGAVVLKRLEDALADRDHIDAVIIGSATNNDGSLKVSYAAPSVAGQAEVIVEALANAGVEPETLTYVETHGTGTALGDPTEVTALTRAFRSGTQKKGFCAIGSVKSNIGHLDAAAGVASLIKTILALKHRTIPPSLHYTTANLDIDFEHSPFYVNSRLSEWKSDGTPRRAGVSAFGVGGTNAHVIVQETPEPEPSSASRAYQLLVLSAKTSSALEIATQNLIAYFKHHPELKLKLPDAAYTLQVGRKAFNHRRVIVCQDINDVVSTPEAADSKQMFTVYQEKRNPPVVFMFSGQGSQYVNMGLELYRTESEFQEHVDRCSEILTPHLSLDLRDILYPAGENVERAAQNLKQTFITQPTLFVIEYALAKLWMSWGVHPEALVGHSIGEYVAACLAGVFSLEDALTLVATRGRLMQELPGGSMLAVFLSDKEIEPFLGQDLSLAAINGPSVCTVSGEKEAIEDLEKQLSEKNVECRHVYTSHAFHSKMVEPILDTFAEQVKQIRRHPPQIPIISNATGTWMTSDEAMDPNYWARHLRQTVRFSDCVQELLKEPNRVLLEVGPGQTLITLARQHLNNSKEQILLSSMRHPKEQKSDIAFILTTLGKLWLAGIQVDWSGFYKDEKRHRLPLPTYPFERKRYWVAPAQRPQGFLASQAGLTKDVAEQPTQAEDLARTIQQSADQFASEPVSEDEYDAPRTEAEVLLAAIWQEVLGVDRVSVDDNFYDLGGDSLSSVRVIERIRKETGAQLSPDIFVLDTLGQIAARCPLKPSLAELKPAEDRAGQQPASLARRIQHKTKMNPFYFRDSQKPLFGMYHPPRPQVARDVGVLLCYPIVQEYMRTHWAFRRLSNLLSKAGFHVLRFDYYGTGDSAGESGEGNVSQWKTDIRSAVGELKDTFGVKKVSLVGLRLGAALAAEASTKDLNVKDLVLWNPVVNGKSYIDKLKAMHYNLFPVHREQAADENSSELLGFPFPPEMRIGIEQMDLSGGRHCVAERIFLVVSQEGNEYLQLRDQLTALGVQIHYRIIPDSRGWNKIEESHQALPTNDILHTITEVLTEKLT